MIYPMFFAALALLVSCKFEILSTRMLWRWRRLASVIAIVLAALGAALVLWCYPGVWAVVISLVGAYRVFNIFRIGWGRGSEHYVKRAGWQSAWILGGLQFGLFAVWQLWRWLGVRVDAEFWLWLVAFCSLVSAIILLLSLARNLRKTRPIINHNSYSDNDLPTITVAIPARNETEDLQSCLVHLVDSDYPKLEILVLDDNSQERRTPEIIRSFAHDGVRFLAGKKVADDWLAKNQAYDQLAREASGEYIVFCGVDIVFERQSLRELVSILLTKQKTMMAVLPERSPLLTASYSLVQPMRYWWEMVPPRRFFNRPPVLSSAWIVHRQFLEEAGGFGAVRRSIVPEAYFAQRALKSDGYSFVRSADKLGITSVKSSSAQRDTAVRTRYPQMHRHIEFVAALTAMELLLLFAPFALGAAGFLGVLPPLLWVLALGAAGLLIASYQLLVTRLRLHNWWFGLLAFPFVVLGDIVLTHYSMWKYEFSSVAWRGRNVCIPVMHAIPHLPPIDKHR